MHARQYALIGRSRPFEPVGRVSRDRAHEWRAYFNVELVTRSESRGVGRGGVKVGGVGVNGVKEAGVVGAEVVEVEEL